jgi:hypothetical protein
MLNVNMILLKKKTMILIWEKFYQTRNLVLAEKVLNLNRNLRNLKLSLDVKNVICLRITTPPQLSH